MADTDKLDRYLRTPEAARFLGISPRTMEKHRMFGTGPLYLKLGGRVVYTQEDLRHWAEQGRRSSTSDPGTGTVRPAKPISGQRSGTKHRHRSARSKP